MFVRRTLTSSLRSLRGLNRLKQTQRQLCIEAQKVEPTTSAAGSPIVGESLIDIAVKAEGEQLWVIRVY